MILILRTRCSILRNNMSSKLKDAKGAYVLFASPFLFARGQWPLYCTALGYTETYFFVAASCSVGVKIEEKKRQFGYLWAFANKKFPCMRMLDPPIFHLTLYTPPFGGCQIGHAYHGTFSPFFKISASRPH